MVKMASKLAPIVLRLARHRFLRRADLGRWISLVLDTGSLLSLLVDFILLISIFVLRRAWCYGRSDAVHQDHLQGRLSPDYNDHHDDNPRGGTTVDLIETREKPTLSGTDEALSLFNERLISVSQRVFCDCPRDRTRTTGKPRQRARGRWRC